MGQEWTRRRVHCTPKHNWTSITERRLEVFESFLVRQLVKLLGEDAEEEVAVDVGGVGGGDDHIVSRPQLVSSGHLAQIAVPANAVLRLYVLVCICFQVLYGTCV